MKINEVADGRLLDKVREDEESWGLYEGPFTPIDDGEAHRYQVVYVRRPIVENGDGVLHAFVTDMGLHSLNTYPPIRILSVGTDSVGQVIELAAQTRQDHAPALPDVDADKWIRENLDHVARKREAVEHRTQFGPGSVPSLEQRNR